MTSKIQESHFKINFKLQGGVSCKE